MNNEDMKIMAVTNRGLCNIPFADQIERICLGQMYPLPQAIILREKDLPEAEYEKLASEVLAITERYGVPLILHTYPDVARRLGVRRIHLPLWKLKEIAGAERAAGEEENVCAEAPSAAGAAGGAGLAALRRDFDVIGSSIHAPEEALEAQSLGATYVTAGHIYLTDCKKGLPARGLTFLKNVCKEVQIPVYGIGGIKFDETQYREVTGCGAAGVCVMSGYMR